MDGKARWIVVMLIWFALLGAGVWGYTHFWKPAKEKAVEQAKQAEHDRTIQNTSSDSRYAYTVVINADAFSGYCLIRSRTFREECAKRGIGINIVDDGADYNRRLKDLAEGTAQMATFTIDTLITASAQMGDMPATIVLLMDETNGADAMVGSGKVFPNLDTLNDPDVKIVATSNSPSEFLARILMRHYNLPLLKPNAFKFVNGAAEVYKVYRNSDSKTKQVYVLWEPYVSKMKANPDYHVLVDSSKFRGYLVDVLVVSRDFAVKNPGIVDEVVKAYLTTVYNRRNDMADLFMEDARSIEPINKDDAANLVNTIWIKNTTENFAHMGLLHKDKFMHIDEMIGNITDVLVATNAIKSDPAKGRYSLWYYNAVLQKLSQEKWHPGFGNEEVREAKVLVKLSDEEWKRLEPIGTLNVPPLVFARGTANLTEGSEAILTDLLEKLGSWQQYYLIVRGNCAKSNDPDVQQANLDLAKARSQAAMDWLVQHGVDANRIHIADGEPSGYTTVAFVLGQIPY
jgi:ABC-type taurine transport system substrate-binding protein/outer membrane protein OmpA-like peptidoglycan-associated protein